MTFSRQTAASSKLLSQQHAIWLGRQHIADILRFQIQQEAVSKALGIRNAARVDNRKSQLRKQPHMKFMEAQKLIDVHVSEITALNLFEQKCDPLEARYVRLTFGTWSHRTQDLVSDANPMVWDGLDISVLLPMARIKVGQLQVEAFQKSDIRADTLLGSAWVLIGTLLGDNVGKDVELSVPLMDHRKQPAGTINLKIRADLEGKKAPRFKDPNNLNKTHQPLTIRVPDSRRMSTMNLRVLEPPAPLEEQELSFSNLVADLRGDGIDSLRMMIGDIHLEDITRLGYSTAPTSVKVRVPFNPIFLLRI